MRVLLFIIITIIVEQHWGWRGSSEAEPFVLPLSVVLAYCVVAFEVRFSINGGGDDGGAHSG